MTNRIVISQKEITAVFLPSDLISDVYAYLEDECTKTCKSSGKGQLEMNEYITNHDSRQVLMQQI